MSASPAVGVTPTLIGRGTHEAFKVKSDKMASFEFEAEAKNESGAPAKDVTVIIAPVGGAFRGELPGPGPYCPS